MQTGGIRSLEKGLQLLRAIQSAQAPLRLKEVAKAADMSASMARGYLVSLVRKGFVVQDGDTGKYDLGEAALQLGLSALGRLDVLAVSRSGMAELAAELGETVALALWSGSGPVVVDKIESRRDQVYEVRVGSPVRLWPTATGRVFMAYLPHELWRGELDRQLALNAVPHNERTTFENELAQVRRARFASTLPSTVPGFAAIAAPVLDHRGELRAVITVLGRADGFDLRPAGPNVTRVTAVAQAISLRLGHTASSPAQSA